MQAYNGAHGTGAPVEIDPTCTATESWDYHAALPPPEDCIEVPTPRGGKKGSKKKRKAQRKARRN